MSHSRSLKRDMNNQANWPIYRGHLAVYEAPTSRSEIGMQRFLPSLWLLAAALYAAATLLLDHALFAAAPPAQVAVHETVVAKQPATGTDMVTAATATVMDTGTISRRALQLSGKE